MKKKLILLLIISVISLSVSSQSIYPDATTAVCPNENVTFTVIVPGYNATVASWTNGPTVIQGLTEVSHTNTTTTYTFIGQFRDVNIAQAFDNFISRKWLWHYCPLLP